MRRLIGAIVRKLTFVTAYTIGLYIYFLISLGVAGYFLSVILRLTHEDTVVFCQDAIKTTQFQEQCASFFQTFRKPYTGFVSAVLVLEFCKFCTAPKPRPTSLWYLVSL
jgi:hypothetical protein